MSDTKDNHDNPTGGEKKTLGLKRGGSVEKGTVKQSFSHGRSKAVVVEKKKRRVVVPGQEGSAAPAPAAASSSTPAASQSRPEKRQGQQQERGPQQARRGAGDAQKRGEGGGRGGNRNNNNNQRGGQRRGGGGGQGGGAVLKTLTKGEADARLAALKMAKVREVEDAKRRAEEAKRQEILAAQRAVEAEKQRVEDEARAKREAEEAAVRAKAEAEAKAKREAEAAAKAAEAPKPAQREERPARSGDRPQRSGDRGPRPGGDRGPRPAGDRGPRPAGDRGPRPGGDRGPRPAGDRGPRPAGDRGPRPGGDRGGRPPMRDGKPPNLNGPRPGGGRPGGISAAPAESMETGKEVSKKALKPALRPKKPVVAAKPTPKGNDDRRKSKLTITRATGGDESRNRSLASMRRRREKEKRKGQKVVREKVAREVVLPEVITIQDLAQRMSERAVDVIKLLMKQGQMMKINDVIDADSAELIAAEMGHTVKRVSEADVEEGLFTVEDNDTDLSNRPPVVTIMGHVDHGKTSLLDALRKENVASGEAGGITQHIGAYQVEQNGQKVTFIDTPGHAAFTQMRARGAKSTDVVILVVAADDGVMPQTKEAIVHAKAAGVPLIIAINKMDKPGADPSRVRNDLLREDLVVETMGGDVIDVEVSAKEGTNLDKLIEMILLQAEVLELKANPNRAAEGTVIEAKLDVGRGPVATVLVQKGTLRVGDVVIAGSEWGRVRAMLDENGKPVKEAGPSKPVEVLGFQATPSAGDMVAVVENEGRAREISEYRHRQKRDKMAARIAGSRGSLEAMMKGLQEEGKKEFPLIIKSDVQGSAEAIQGALEELGNDEVGARVVAASVGGITESDITLAIASKAPIMAFNVRANKQAQEAARREGVEIRYYSVIYDLIDDVKSTMSGMLAPERRETFLGYADIKEIFNITKIGRVAGCLVTEGVVQRGAQVRLLRDNVVIHEGELGTLKRFKDEVKEVESGVECGMNFTNYKDMRVGDVIECFQVEEIARSL
ncbi:MULTISPECIES: translation initiation factor IF-2 [unclassified Pseudovibrio]|uniref:translation initiation factor IF-2 n=1 Tax=unclassified Pseudovibrio TaxID=2627060 RepID=UPI0007AE431D|nr:MULTISPECIES: translation initiation factor IF-2 [unclassified Pseudovibrio]KZK89102.1 Translation initiation factor IF-2 [Pseudovibrio sp. Ad5]KZL03227.1 Translation initiation factor IF-2 [Pseudovibrio sp. W74]KZL12319.1 Translation initiation factor IF-2 [Pseudovibrio sp. Ad14]KZL27962.1 Translation initiation factor IF-2 [Pseudovibrio sp. WM33]KZL28699.1 Translation initiation factor IF-2 [Pseudovibrio sp. Ad37]